MSESEEQIQNLSKQVRELSQQYTKLRESAQKLRESCGDIEVQASHVWSELCDKRRVLLATIEGEGVNDNSQRHG